MSQTVPDVPSIPYGVNNGYGNYPPARPGPHYAQSTGAYSVARDKVLQGRAVKQVELFQGNLVLDVPVSSHIIPAGRQDVEEMSEMHYTAATCDPDDFLKSRYSLRPYLLGRQTELFIVMTMYNKDEVLFTKTMNAVLKNIAHLCGRSKSKTWGSEGWKKVVVCVVSDGHSKINKRALQVLSLMGCYQDGIAKDSVAGKDVTAHIFEYTSSVMVTELVCVLLDVGTKPTGTSIHELWKCFDKHSNVGGACGEICVDTGRGCSLLLTRPLAASQNFEYKMSNILDKPLENGPDGKGPLPASYFKGETMHGGGPNGAGLFERNMHLVEDCILRFEIVTTKQEEWVYVLFQTYTSSLNFSLTGLHRLKYAKSAKASTNVPASVPEFISPRRRWLNGSLFASIHSTVFWFKIWTSGQNFFRKSF
ncbi:chitin synthase-domain-containing protein [Lentinula aff. detonsa]|uniref:Chitin synthase n=1 Tax=Lentinula aff. detonsa TaxID=2804958 RepID=A0AA38KP79_9AGAR|nr:chitin synthase-domain-containing protein [Lentinula aff. detonsa]